MTTLTTAPNTPAEPARPAGPRHRRPRNGRNRRTRWVGWLRRAAGALPLLTAVVTVLSVCLPGRTAELASLALVLAAAVAVACRWRTRAALPPRAVVLLGAPLVGFAVATAASGDPAASLPGFVRCAQVFVLLPLALVLLLRSHREARLLGWCAVAVAVAQGALGAHQYATGTGATYMGQFVRAVGTFGPQHVMGMATAVSYGLVIALCLGLAPAPGRTRGRHAAPSRRPAAGRTWRRALALVAAVLSCAPLAVSFSRGAWLATAAAVLVVLVAAAYGGTARASKARGRLRRRLLLALGAGALLLGAGAAVTLQAASGAGLVAERLGSIGDVSGTPDQSVIDRYAMWEAAVAMWRTEPLTGVGPKAFAEHRDTHASLALSSGSDTGAAGTAFQRQELLSPHNLYLLVLSEQGLVGAGTLFGCWAALLAACLARLRRAAPEERGVGLAATGLLVWHAVNFLYADIGGPTTVLTAVALGLAAWWALSPAARRPPSPPPPPPAAGRTAPRRPRTLIGPVARLALPPVPAREAPR
ncbi:O-antigen ligase family protein [Streptomyces sp. B6B3]|uniref:O-antigen ligase family protein n=1 Tax=Streptomyces sp. B6B3 TaxID=3153570 RepID=UPI00325C3980